MTLSAHTTAPGIDLELAIKRIAEGSRDRDAAPGFPTEPFKQLAAAGVLGFPAPEASRASGTRAAFADEWRVLRAVSKADGSVGRILDGHFNGVERISVLAPEPLRSRELAAVVAGELLVGVWGADPIPGEGMPAELIHSDDGPMITGVKTFCSGATGLDRALVLVRGPEKGPPLVAYVGLSENVEVDRSWYKASGMRSSESHRVVFHETPVLAILGEPGELLREPYFSRDAVRTAICWAGIADRAVDAALDTLAAKSGDREPDDLVSLAAGKMLTAQQTMDRWIEHAANRADANPESSLSGFSIQLRESVAATSRTILDKAARACGSHPFATAGALDLARRDLELFVLQHRLEPALARAGRQAILNRRPHS
ncbi:hypothetical protein BH24ACT22_BH24ACT22_04780 [soil metagenome]